MATQLMVSLSKISKSKVVDMACSAKALTTDLVENDISLKSSGHIHIDRD